MRSSFWPLLLVLSSACVSFGTGQSPVDRPSAPLVAGSVTESDLIGPVKGAPSNVRRCILPQQEEPEDVQYLVAETDSPFFSRASHVLLRCYGGFLLRQCDSGQRVLLRVFNGQFATPVLQMGDYHLQMNLWRIDFHPSDGQNSREPMVAYVRLECAAANGANDTEPPPAAE